MKLSTISIIWVVLYGGFGLGLLIIPVQFMTTYGVSLDHNGVLFARILGAALIAFAYTFYLNRNLSLSDRGWIHLIRASFLYHILVIPILTIATLDGVINSMGWIPVGVHVFHALTFAYFSFKN